MSEPTEPARIALEAEQFKFLCDDAHKAGEQAAAYGQSAMKSLFLANGAAIISLLTFLGNTNAQYESTAIFWSFVWFSIGLSASMIAHYLLFKLLNTNRMYSFFCALRLVGEDVDDKVSLFSERSDRFKDRATEFALLSLTLFVLGAFVALDAVT